MGTMIDGRGPAGRLSTIEPPLAEPALAPEPAPRRPRRPAWSIRAAVALALQAVAATIAALVITNVRISRRPAVSTNDVNSIVNQKVKTAISQLQSQPPAAVTAYGAVRAGLVLVVSQHRSGGGSEDLGSGIIIDTQGDILTALHVVQGASRINVTFFDGVTSTASITSSNPADDIAVLSSQQLPPVVAPAVLGSDPQVGDQDFDVIVDSSSVGSPKPDPAAYLFALQGLNEAPGDCVAVEDNVDGVLAAVAAGVPCVAFANENTGQHDFSGAATRVGRLDFAELQSLTAGRQEAR